MIMLQNQGKLPHFFLLSLLFSFLFNLILWLVIFLKVRESLTPYPLHYNIYFGIDLLGSPSRLFVIPLAGLIIVIINSILSWLILKVEKLLSYFLGGISLCAQLILLLASLSIILL